MKLRHLLFLLIISGGIKAQAPLVSKIVIKGNKITLDKILLREIQHTAGVPLDSSLARDDRDRLLNLGIFADVYWAAVPIEDLSVILEYEVIESKRFIGGPVPIFDEKTGFSLTVGLIWNNFRGRNETLMAGATFGGRFTFGLNYLNPWISGDHLSLNMETGRNIEDHPFLPYEIRTNSFELNVGRFYGYSRRVSLGFELEEKLFVSVNDKIFDRSYQYFAPQGVFQYDTRDLYLEPTRGILIIQSISSLWDLKREKKSTAFWYQSYSYFHKLNKGPKNLVWGLNFSAYTTLGKIDEVWIGYIGSSSTVRGWKLPDRKLYAGGESSNRVGHHYILFSSELRKTFIPRRVSTFGMEYGLTLALFFDGGIISESLPELNSQIPILGTGISLQIPFPILGMLRVDYGFGFEQGEYRGTSWHVNFQQKF